ncbi:MAG: ABC transporter ATP-binding protein [Candidatus Wallbacteria bacterium HGW-Wallbacteria-1]|jgi:subfamily B ATP-binding cassette protein MsbA|uniref:ABC transporter ATP-binding protein n=1 Tax=Candidatus Wallbacteria bacterium HGW-Wallbacteria-1 TaxID=2013854 RepID=A0A2N1PT10_9BACT|nr:MAG: ABC transporter ATP-binding protein [Candidatus Wallbacteria bacterium HGW-Wallbacteria-1]
MNLFRRTLLLFGPYIGKLIFASFCSLFVAVGNSAPAYVMLKIIDNVLLEKDTQVLQYVVIGIILVMFVKGFFYYLQTYTMSWVGQDMVRRLRDSMYHKVMHQSLTYFDTRMTGHTMSRIMNDVSVLQNLIAFSLSFITDILTVGALVAWVVYLDWKLTLLVLLVIPAISLVISIFSRKMRRLGTAMQEKVSDITAVLQESLGAVRVIKCFAREERAIEGFENVNNRSFETNMKSTRVQSLVVPVVENLNTIGLGLVLWYGGLAVIGGRITSGELVSFLSALGMMFTPMKRLTYINNYVQQSLSAAERIFELLDDEVLVSENPDAVDAVFDRGHVKFRDVWFSYLEGPPVLKGINLEVKSGQVVAFVGSSGSGKSTLVNLVPRLYDPTRGKVDIDDLDIRNVRLKSLRRNMGIVSQDTVLFSGTIEDNIAYGVDEIDRDRVMDAARAANAHDFIQTLPDGYLTEVGERGVKLSGGQKQRIAIARAIMTNPRILILDEATSALDSESEKLVQDALERLMKGRTTLVIAHRLSTITNADRIIYLDAGEIREEGTHQELLDRGGLYAALFETQYQKVGLTA